MSALTCQICGEYAKEAKCVACKFESFTNELESLMNQAENEEPELTKGQINRISLSMIRIFGTKITQQLKDDR
jgi:hypothetical protein